MIVRIGAVANLRPVKNIDGLIRVATAVCRADARVHFDVAGEGEQRAALEEQLRATSLNGRFKLHGAVSDVPRFLATLDIAVLCSHSESMSNALLEYMAAGRAIVATDVGANAKLIRHGRDGLIVPAGDDAGMVSAITFLLERPAVAQALGFAAQNRAKNDFSRCAMVRRFEEFFVSVTNS